MQIALTGFLESKTAPFMLELWNLLRSAQESSVGIPTQFIEEKKAEMKQREESSKFNDERALMKKEQEAEIQAKMDSIRQRERTARDGRRGEDNRRDRGRGGFRGGRGNGRDSGWRPRQEQVGDFPRIKHYLFSKCAQERGSNRSYRDRSRSPYRRNDRNPNNDRRQDDRRRRSPSPRARRRSRSLGSTASGGGRSDRSSVSPPRKRVRSRSPPRQRRRSYSRSPPRREKRPLSPSREEKRRRQSSSPESDRTRGRSASSPDGTPPPRRQEASDKPKSSRWDKN